MRLGILKKKNLLVKQFIKAQRNDLLIVDIYRLLLYEQSDIQVHIPLKIYLVFHSLLLYQSLICSITFDLVFHA